MQIKRAAVLGAGVMGATIAAHLANAGLEVLLLDMAPAELNEAERDKGLTLESPAVRNRIAAGGLEAAIKGRGLYHKKYASQITVGNFIDDMQRIRECDWVVEVVVENMAIKKQMLTAQIVPNLAEGAILTTNTSGLSINEMAELLPEAIRKNFLVTHFFNPPRYMRLLELVPSRYTDPAVLAFMADFCSRRLGKGIVYGKDTPNFIANRIGVFAICNGFHHMVDMGMTVEEVDAIAGPATARAGSATFRTSDLVGIDTLVKVADNTYELVAGDTDREIFKMPEFVREMVARGLTGNKAKQGFFKKEKDGGISFYDYQSCEYKPAQKPQFDSVAATKKCKNPADKLTAILSGNDKAAEFAWRNLRDTLLYAVKLIPEIADDVVNVDNGMKWGFSWEIGPFEMLDAIGVAEYIRRVEADGLQVPASLRKVEKFYRYEGADKHAWNLTSDTFAAIPVKPGRVNLDVLRRAGRIVESNPDASLFDLGDGVFGLEFHSKMNAIGSDTIAMISKATARVEAEGTGLVIGNHGKAFSAGANLAMFAKWIREGELTRIEEMVREFQNALMGLKYSSVPVVAAPFGMALGGGCEVTLHSNAVTAHAETGMGLVEIGVGLLPAGGGTKEMALRAMEIAEPYRADVQPYIIKQFMNIVTAKVSGSAAELYDMGMLTARDSVTMDIDNLLADAKQKVLALSCNYRPGKPVEGLKAPGRSIGAVLKSQVWNMMAGGFATAYEVEIATIVADVMTGGDVPAGTLITEQYLLDLEREGFLRLCGNSKTLERIEHMLKTGKALRN
jgi:3-hydroxyacyl-CoA dehydrogenase